MIELQEPQPQPTPVAPGPAEQRDPVVSVEKPEMGQPTEVIVREIVETLLLTLFIFWIVNTATGRFRIEGHSMMPTLQEGEYIIINKLSYYLDEPERGDIIVLRFPNDRTRDFIKRVVGIPGDQIEIGNGVVTVNGVALTEPYLNAPPSYNGSWTVPADSYFVLGDNRNNSHDSHNWNFLPRSDIIGKAWVIYWKPENWGLVPHYPHPIG